jgi:hypothetical protein
MPSTFTYGNLLFKAKPSVPVEQAILGLSHAIRQCEVKRNFASGESVCRATRAVWTAIHQQALYDPVLLPSETLSDASEHITKGIKALKGVEFTGKSERISEQRRKIERKFPESMSLRRELVDLLKGPGGLIAVAEKVNVALKD